MLRHERATLLTTVATLVITIGLYVIIPKGFLPPQDTGLITAVMEAGPEVSFAEMQRLQARSPTPCARIPTSRASSPWSASARSTRRPTPAT